MRSQNRLVKDSFDFHKSAYDGWAARLRHDSRLMPLEGFQQAGKALKETTNLNELHLAHPVKQLVSLCWTGEADARGLTCANWAG
jgi:hypothetical protein